MKNTFFFHRFYFWHKNLKNTRKLFIKFEKKKFFLEIYISLKIKRIENTFTIRKLFYWFFFGNHTSPKILRMKIKILGALDGKIIKAMLSVHWISGVRYTPFSSLGGDFFTGHFEVTSKIHLTPEWMRCKMYPRFRMYKKHFPNYKISIKIGVMISVHLKSRVRYTPPILGWKFFY